MRETPAYKPDSVVPESADGHFSTVKIALDVTFSVARKRCNQPGNSAGRVIISCLVLHRTEVTLTRVVANAPVRFYRTFSPFLEAVSFQRFVSVALFRAFDLLSAGRR